MSWNLSQCAIFFGEFVVFIIVITLGHHIIVNVLRVEFHVVQKNIVLEVFEGVLIDPPIFFESMKPTVRDLHICVSGLRSNFEVHLHLRVGKKRIPTFKLFVKKLSDAVTLDVNRRCVDVSSRNESEVRLQHMT